MHRKLIEKNYIYICKYFEWDEGRNCNDYKILSKIYCVLSTVENLKLLEKKIKR